MIDRVKNAVPDWLQQAVVIVVKGGVSALVAWLAAKGIDVTPGVVSALEVGVAGVAVGVANWVLNLAAQVLRKIPKVGVVFDLLWPTPHYDKAELRA